MGTSTSYRAPSTPRWNAFIAALTGGAPLDRLRSELFNAGNEWELALAAPAIASYAMTVNELYEGFPGRLEAVQRLDEGVVNIIADARASSANAGFSPALPVAERALARLIIEALDGIASPAASTGALADRWREARGDSANALVAKFAGQVVSQYARHVIDREAGRLAVALPQVRSSALSSSLAAAAAELTESAANQHLANRTLTVSGWSTLLHRAFATGRALPAK